MEKAASQLSSQFPLLSGSITEQYRLFLCGRTFIEAIQYDGDIKKLVSSIWKKLRNGTNSAFVGRTVLVPGTNKRYMQPGHLYFDLENKLIKLEWFACEKNGHPIPDHCQLEMVLDIKQLPPFDDGHLTYTPFIFSRSLWGQGVFWMLAPSSFKKLLKPPKLSPSQLKSPSAKSIPSPKKSAKVAPPSAKHALEFPPTSSTKKSKMVQESDFSKTSQKWKFYRCHYKSKGIICENEAVWCDKESSKEPKYCDVVPCHKLDTAQFYYWDLRGRGGFPDSDSKGTCDSNQQTCAPAPANEEQGEIDMDVGGDSESES